MLTMDQTTADECQPFLQRFQASKPMTPYLFEAVEKLERRITPGEALNHAFVTLAHLVDYAHCNNVKASVQMMEVCRRNSYSNSHHQQTQQAPPLVANFVPSSNGNVTLTFNNQVQRLVRERATGYDNLVCFQASFIDSLFFLSHSHTVRYMLLPSLSWPSLQSFPNILNFHHSLCP
uniref:Uncharacterized protein n=1 Tax=Timema shepardi TaxID=629360 RepID=A0A7R9BBJ3_TIMSH|nr:unnamed protein product [Timema shepardi]